MNQRKMATMEMANMAAQVQTTEGIEVVLADGTKGKLPPGIVTIAEKKLEEFESPIYAGWAWYILVFVMCALLIASTSVAIHQYNEDISDKNTQESNERDMNIAFLIAAILGVVAIIGFKIGAPLYSNYKAKVN